MLLTGVVMKEIGVGNEKAKEEIEGEKDKEGDVEIVVRGGVQIVGVEKSVVVEGGIDGDQDV